MTDRAQVQEPGTLRMAYADPPYIGQSHRHYRDHPDYAGEVDHLQLIGRLLREYPDGWALSLSSPSIFRCLAMCEGHGLKTMDGDIRVMAWVKPFAAFKRNVRVAYAWEPVIVKPARRLEGAIPTRDYIAEPITMKRGLTGAKPEAVCHWLFAVMGLRPGSGDEMHDLFPGSGAVARAWETFNQQLPAAA